MRQYITTATAIVIGFALAACGGGNEFSGSSSTGGGVGSGGQTLRISITDAPFPSEYVESATVVIKEVLVHERGGDSWQRVFSGSREIDLVPLTGGVAELLVDATVEPGVYNEARLIVEAGTVTLKPNAVVQDDYVFSVDDGDLKFPSGPQTGIKVKVDNDITVTSQLSGDLVLDFDLAKSFVFNGPFTHAPGVMRVIFKPVVRATNASTNGTVSLDVFSDNATPEDSADDVALAGATIRVCDDMDTEIAMGLTDADGHFETSLPDGTYTLKIEAAHHDAADIQNVVVVLANITDAGSITMVVHETEITGVVLSDGATTADTTDDTNLVAARVEAIAAGDATMTVVSSAMTDANGAFVLTGLTPGSYDLKFSASGWTTLTWNDVASVVPGSGAGGVTATLVALTRDLTGTVTDNSATAMSGVTVSVINSNGTTLAASAATGADGVYTLAGVPSGTHTLKADDGVAPFSKAITVVGTNPATSQTEDVQFP